MAGKCVWPIFRDVDSHREVKFQEGCQFVEKWLSFSKSKSWTALDFKMGRTCRLIDELPVGKRNLNDGLYLSL